MSKFNGFSKIELEMLVDELEKSLPMMLALVPTFASLTKAHFDELKKQGFKDSESMYMAVQSAGKQLGLK